MKWIGKAVEDEKVSKNDSNLFMRYKLPDSTVGYIKADNITPEIESLIKDVLEKLKIEIK